LREANGSRECAPDDRLRDEAIHRAPAVIASEAKQSISPRKERMDCFAPLAMTWSSRHVFTASPRDAPEPSTQPVVAGLDPAIHLLWRLMDARIKPGHDEVWLARHLNP